MSTREHVNNGSGIGVGKYSSTTATTWGDLAGGQYISIAPNTSIGGTMAPSPPYQAEEILRELRQLRADFTTEQTRTKAEILVLADKIEALHQMIEADTTLEDRKDAKRKIAALEEQLAEFREYYEESEEDIYKK